jgi:hypothetical protein
VTLIELKCDVSFVVDLSAEAWQQADLGVA